MIVKRSKTFSYKKAHFTTPLAGSTTLQAAVMGAMAKKLTVKRKLRNPSGDEKTFVFFNYGLNHGSPNAGGEITGMELITFERGAAKSTFEENLDATDIPLKALRPGEGATDFVEASLYAGFLDNHVIVMQSLSLRTKDLEDYLNWLLRERVPVLGPDNHISLIDALPLKKKAQFKGAKSISFSSPVEMVYKEKAISHSQREIVEVKPKGFAWEAIKTFMKGMAVDGLDLPENLRPQDILKAKGLTVALKLSWDRKIDQDGGDMLSTMGYQMRHVTDEVDYAVETKDGKITRDDFKPREKVQIPWDDESERPVFEHVFPSMMKWLAELEQAGKIDA